MTPQTTASKTFDLCLKSIALVANVTVAAALVVGVMSYHAENRRTKISNTLQFIGHFDAGELSLDRRRILEQLVLLDFSALREADLTVQVRQAFNEQFVATSPNPVDMLVAISNITSYFDRAYICVDQNICDKELLLSHLGPYALNFFCIFAPTITVRKVQGLSLKHGLGLQKLVLQHSPHGCSDDSY